MTALVDLRRRLAGVPDAQPPVTAAIEDGIADSVRYLGSDAAERSLDADIYWPKWDSPWWHMLALWEMGEARRIPRRIVDKMFATLGAFPLKIFPIHPGELPPGASPSRDVLCHCAIGSVAQVLAACGRDVDRELPFIEAWCVRYQMADGGLNCDETAYLSDECPSSMVGTVAPFEAMLGGSPAAWSAERAAFVERGAAFLIARQLMHGSPTRHNAEERTGEAAWLAPCFPRFYLYDVIRGLDALVRGATLTGRPVPLAALAGVVDHLLTAFPDGAVIRRRRCYDGVGTWMQSPSGEWTRHKVALQFPLLEAISALDQPCPYLTRQWSQARRGIINLIDLRQVAG